MALRYITCHDKLTESYVASVVLTVVHIRQVHVIYARQVIIKL